MTRLAAVLLAVALAGCADPTSVGEQPSASPSGTPSARSGSYAADGLVLQVRYEGGMAGPSVLAPMPFWSLYGDGRVVTVGASPAIYPGAALPPLNVGTVTPGAVDRIVADARAAGVDGVDRDYGEPRISDASTTVFELATEQGSVETRVYALSEAEDDTGNAARARLRAFLRRLTSAEPDDGYAVSDDEAYQPAAVAAYARPYGDERDGVDPNDLDWPGPDLADGTDTPAGACTVLRGAALADAMPALRKATTITRWHSAGRAWSVQLRPLLPDERDCSAGIAA